MTHDSATITRASDGRRTETPNAVMTTLASPTLAGTTDLCLWRVAFAAGASGPIHAMDTEQIWLLESGTVTCEVDGTAYDLTGGDAIRIAGGVDRQFRAATGSSFIVCGRPGALATTPAGGEPVTPPWIA